MAGDASQATGAIRWGDDDFSDDWTEDDSGAAADVSGRWGDEESGDWDDSESGAWGDSSGSGDSPSWLSPAPPSSPAALREIQTTKVGIIETQFARRNGIFAEVTVQHKGAPSTVTIVQFAKEVRACVAQP